MLLSAGASLAFALAGGERGLLSFPCLDRVRVVVAPRGRTLPLGCSGISRLSTVWPLPVLLRAGRERAIPCLGWCGFRAWWRRGVGDDGMPRDCTRLGAVAGFPCVCVVCLFPRVADERSGGGCLLCGVFAACIVVRPFDCLFVGCGLRCRVLLVCGCSCCLLAIVWCAFRERACVWCDMVHVGLCGRAFGGNRDCRLFFTV